MTDRTGRAPEERLPHPSAPTGFPAMRVPTAAGDRSSADSTFLSFPSRTQEERLADFEFDLVRDAALAEFAADEAIDVRCVLPVGHWPFAVHRDEFGDDWDEERLTTTGGWGPR